MNQLNFVLPIYTSNNSMFILCNIFDPIPGGKVAIQSLVKRIEVLIPVIIWRKFGQMLLPAPGWHLLKLKNDELNTEVAFFDPSLDVSHWIDSFRCLSCCRFYLFINLFAWSFNNPEQGGGILVLKSRCNWEQEFYYELLLLLLDFPQRILKPCWIFTKAFKSRDLTPPKAFKFQYLKPPKAFRFQDLKPLRCTRRLLKFDI